jgi:hypothetical protein
MPPLTNHRTGAGLAGVKATQSDRFGSYSDSSRTDSDRKINRVTKMGARERTNFELTLKGAEELEMRTYRLDAKTRNILFLIKRGFPTFEGILENSIFPREEIVERLRNLLQAHFVTMHAAENPSATPTTVSRRSDPTTVGPEAPADSAAEAPSPEPETEQPDEPIYFGL